MTMTQKRISPRKQRNPSPISDGFGFAFVLLDRLEEQFEALEFYRTDGAHDPLNPEPSHQRAKARFWRDISRKIDGIWGGAPPAIEEELAALCVDEAPML